MIKKINLDKEKTKALNPGKLPASVQKEKDESQRHDFVNLRNLRKTLTWVVMFFIILYALSCLFYGLITVFPAIQICFGTTYNGKQDIKKFIDMFSYLIVGTIVGHFISSLLRNIPTK